MSDDTGPSKALRDFAARNDMIIVTSELRVTISPEIMELCKPKRFTLFAERRVLRKMELGGVSLDVHDYVLPDELWAVKDGRIVAKITNIGTEPIKK